MSSSLVRGVRRPLLSLGVWCPGILLTLSCQPSAPSPGAAGAAYVAHAVPGLESCRESLALSISEDQTVSGWCALAGDTITFVAEAARPTRLQQPNPTEASTAAPSRLSPSRRRPPYSLPEYATELGPSNLLGSTLGRITSGAGAPTAFVVRVDGLVLPLAPLPGDSAADPRYLADTCEWVAGASIARDGRRRAAWWQRTC